MSHGPKPLLTIPEEAKEAVNEPAPRPKSIHPFLAKFCRQWVIEHCSMRPTTKNRLLVWCSFSSQRYHQAWWRQYG